MAGAPQQHVGFNFRVWSEGRDEPFSVPASQAAVEAAELKGSIRSSGELSGFTSSSWNIFLASVAGVQQGGALPFNHRFTAADGFIVNVWVEPKPGVVAGEPWGPDSWASGVLGAGLA